MRLMQLHYSDVTKEMESTDTNGANTICAKIRSCCSRTVLHEGYFEYHFAPQTLSIQ